MSFITTLTGIKSWRIDRLQFFYRSFRAFFFLPILRISFEYLNFLTIFIPSGSFLIRFYLIKALFITAIFVSYINLLYKRAHDFNQKWNVEVYIFWVTILLSIAGRLFESNRNITIVLKVLSMFGWLIVLISHIYFCFKKGMVGDNQYWNSLEKK